MNLTLQEVITAIDYLSSEDRQLLYDSLRLQHLAEIEAEILASRTEAALREEIGDRICANHSVRI